MQWCVMGLLKVFGIAIIYDYGDRPWAVYASTKVQLKTGSNNEGRIG